HFPDELQKLSFDALPAGYSGDNVGFVHVVAEPLPENPEKQVLFYQIRNYSQGSNRIQFELSLNGNLIDAYGKEIDPGKSLERNSELNITAPAEVSLNLKTQDLLALDNHFVLRIEPAKRIKVASSFQNPFLLRALVALPAVEVVNQGSVNIGQVRN